MVSFEPLVYIWPSRRCVGSPVFPARTGSQPRSPLPPPAHVSPRQLPTLFTTSCSPALLCPQPTLAHHLACQSTNLTTTTHKRTTTMLFFLPFLLFAPLLALAAPMPATRHGLRKRYYPWNPLRWSIAPSQIKPDTTYDLRWEGGSGNGYVSPHATLWRCPC